MAGGWPLTLGMALALLAVGALLGDLWARLRAPTPRGATRRGRPHYLLGLNYLVSHEPDQAIRELSQAVRQETEAVEAYLALGNLYRESGQSERAIDAHKSLLHRPNLSEWERTQVLFCLAMDFKRAGFVDRAERTFREVAEREPDNVACLYGLQQIAEETGQWEEALALQRQIQRASRGTEPNLLAALETEWGRSLLSADADRAARHFRTALDIRPDYAPARQGMAQCLMVGERYSEALEHLEQAVLAPTPWSTAALQTLDRLCLELGDQAPLAAACETILERDPRAWRAGLYLARVQLSSGDLDVAEATLRRALRERPGSLAVQREVWKVLRQRGGGIEEFAEILEGVLDDTRLMDPFVCLRCGFKSVELFARCLHCHRWNTMAEERQD
ncbi:MAG: tetratricopeptide repeat protein [Acidobacteria bacterium]|nr:tetratricopeptide repeat protein [Acidobacteriota bacterium]